MLMSIHCLSVWQGITGAFVPGVLAVLMGSSGAGKTTLMDVLADRKTGAANMHCAYNFLSVSVRSLVPRRKACVLLSQTMTSALCALT